MLQDYVVAFPERIVPDETEPGIVALHLKRYEFARPWCSGKIVLDAGCGVGYGTAFLAEVAETVVGVDVDEEALAYARGRYARPNVEFVAGDLLDPAFSDRSFDVVCAFEAIEHLDDPETHVRVVARLLRPDGVYIVSTPRAETTTYQPENPFHRVEFSAGDFEQLLRSHFREVELFGQRRLQTRRHRAMQMLVPVAARRLLRTIPFASRLLGTPPTEAVTAADVVIAGTAIDRAAELVGVCRLPTG